MGLLSIALPPDVEKLLLPPLVRSQVTECERVLTLQSVHHFVILWDPENVKLCEMLDAPLAKFTPEWENDPNWYTKRAALADGDVRMIPNTLFELVVMLRRALALDKEGDLDTVASALNALGREKITPETLQAIETVLRLGSPDRLLTFLKSL